MGSTNPSRYSLSSSPKSARLAGWAYADPLGEDGSMATGGKGGWYQAQDSREPTNAGNAMKYHQ